MAPKKRKSITLEMRVAANIVAIRVGLGLTQDQVIERARERGVEISRRALGDWERGQSSPTVTSLAKLERVFGVDIRDLTA